MVDVDLLFSVIICTLCSILLVTLIVLIIKLIKTIGKVDRVIDDVSSKSSKLDGVFNLVDSTTDALSSFGDKVFGSLVSIVSNIISNKKKQKEEDTDE